MIRDPGDYTGFTEQQIQTLLLIYDIIYDVDTAWNAMLAHTDGMLWKLIGKGWVM